MKNIVYLFVATFLCLSTQAKTLQISSFNIRWYGLGGEPTGKLQDEKRDKNLSEFINNIAHLNGSDVIAFQEIVNQEGLMALFPNHNCTGYDHPTVIHQHVMVCVKKPYTFEIEKSDTNYTLESVAIPIKNGKLRPAVHGLVKDQNNAAIAHVIAVHLKAEPDQTKVRVEQIKLIKNHIEKNIKDKTPLIILGDFNTHISKDTGLEKDDYLLFDEILKKGKNKLNHIPNNGFTFRNSKNHYLLDHIWVSPNLKNSGLEIFPICQSDATGEKFMNPEFYYNEVSDHCPITVTFELK